MAESLLVRVQRIVEFVTTLPQQDQLVSFLSSNCCPVGDACGAAISRIDQYGNLECVSAYGFSDNDQLIGHKSALRSDSPGSAAAVTLSVIYLTREDLTGRYRNFAFAEHIDDFSSAVLIPVSNNAIYGFAVTGILQEIPGIDEFVQCLRSIFAFYEVIKLNGSGILTSLIEESSQLTKRQFLILELIKENLTNADIATNLGYSESTIRQETIVIYRKLGINGRKDLGLDRSGK